MTFPLRVRGSACRKFNDCGAIGFVPKPYRLSELCSFLRAKTKAVSPSSC